jgi:Family of unknown function (DUF5808)
MTREELDRVWANPSNWSIVYRCPSDPRVIVPRRRRWMGWTVNFAHPLAWPVVLGCVAIVIAPVLTLLRFGIYSGPLLVTAQLAAVAIVVGIAHWEASRRRA